MTTITIVNHDDENDEDENLCDQIYQKNAAFHPPELEVPEMPSKGECGCPPG